MNLNMIAKALKFADNALNFYLNLHCLCVTGKHCPKTVFKMLKVYFVKWNKICTNLVIQNDENFVRYAPKIV